MDFVERILGVSPDGGSGVTEATYLIAPVVAVLLFSLRSTLKPVAARVLERLAAMRAR